MAENLFTKLQVLQINSTKKFDGLSSLGAFCNIAFSRYPQVTRQLKQTLVKYRLTKRLIS